MADPDPDKIRKHADDLKKDCEYFRTVAKIAAVIPFFGWAAAGVLAAGGAECDKNMEEIAAQNADLWASLQSDDVQAKFNQHVERERALFAQGKPRPPQFKLDMTPSEKAAHEKKRKAWIEAVKVWESKSPPPLVKPEEWQAMTLADREQWTSWVDRYAEAHKFTPLNVVVPTATKNNLSQVLSTLRVPKAPGMSTGSKVAIGGGVLGLLGAITWIVARR